MHLGINCKMKKYFDHFFLLQQIGLSWPSGKLFNRHQRISNQFSCLFQNATLVFRCVAYRLTRTLGLGPADQSGEDTMLANSKT